MIVTPPGAPRPVDAPLPRQRRYRVRQALGRLFPAAPPAAITPVRAALAVAAALAGTAFGLTRVAGPGAMNSVWAEDGKFFLAAALERSTVDSVLTPFNGYFHLVPRLLAEATTLFPIRWAAGVMSTAAALTAAILAVAVYLLSGAHLRSTAVRLLVAAPLVIAPVGQGGAFAYGGSVIDNLATLQFVLVYGLFWVVLWVPARPLGRVLAVGFALAVALSTPIAVVYLPLLLARLYARRDRTSAALLLALLAGFAAQLTGGLTDRQRVGPHGIEPLWLIDSYARWLVPNAVLGERWSHLARTDGALRLTLIVAAWLVVAAALAAALTRWTRPNWPLAAATGCAGVALCLGQLISFGTTADRYLYAPGLLLIATLAILVTPAAPPSRWVGRVPIAALAILLAVVCVANHRVHNHRANARPWQAVVDTATTACADGHHRRVTVYTHTRIRYWIVVIPCKKLR